MISRLLQTGQGRLSGSTAAERRKYLSRVEQATRRRAKFSPPSEKTLQWARGRDFKLGFADQKAPPAGGFDQRRRGGVQHGHLRNPFDDGSEGGQSGSPRGASSSSSSSSSHLRYDTLNPRTGNSILQERFDELVRFSILKYCPRGTNELRMSELFALLKRAKPSFSIQEDADGLPLALLAKNCCYLQSHSGFLHFIRVTAAPHTSARKKNERQADNDAAADDDDDDRDEKSSEGERVCEGLHADVAEEGVQKGRDQQQEQQDEGAEEEEGDGYAHRDADGRPASEADPTAERAARSTEQQQQQQLEDLQKFRYRDLRHRGDGLQCGPEPWRYSASMMPRNRASRY
jgi:hypothetical protein